MHLLFSFDRDMRAEKTLMQTLASQLSSTLMQLLFSFDRGMRVEKTLMQTLASQLSSTLILVYNIQSTVINFHTTLVLV
jgi:mitochondrial fission protein ELM1